MTAVISMGIEEKKTKQKNLYQLMLVALMCAWGDFWTYIYIYIYMQFSIQIKKIKTQN